MSLLNYFVMGNTWDKNLGRFINRHDGRTTLNSIMQRDIPKGQQVFWNKYNDIQQNPNLDFRIRLYEPLMHRARILVKTHGNDFEGLRRQVQGDSYKNFVELTTNAVKDVVAPGPIGYLKPGVGGQFLDGLDGVGKLTSAVGSSVEWNVMGEERKVLKAFWLQVDQLVDTLGGSGGNEMMVGKILRGEAAQQMEWDIKIAKTPKEVIEKAFGQQTGEAGYPKMFQGKIEPQKEVPQKSDGELSNELLLKVIPPWEPLPQSKNMESSELSEGDKGINLSGNYIFDKAQSVENEYIEPVTPAENILMAEEIPNSDLVADTDPAGVVGEWGDDENAPPANIDGQVLESAVPISAPFAESESQPEFANEREGVPAIVLGDFGDDEEALSDTVSWEPQQEYNDDVEAVSAPVTVSDIPSEELQDADLVNDSAPDAPMQPPDNDSANESDYYPYANFEMP